jgi:hypothetical protein
VIEQVATGDGIERTAAILLLLCSQKDARLELAALEMRLGRREWISAGVDCPKDEDVVPVAIATFLSLAS